MVSLSRWWGFRLRLSARLSLTVAANANTTALRCIDIPSATSIFAGAAASPQTPPLLPLALSRQPAPAPLARLPGGPVVGGVQRQPAHDQGGLPAVRQPVQ